jgi:hypothetical protein
MIDKNKLYILDKVTGEYLEIQFVPLEISYNPESKFIPIASPGRNNALYHYTGSEDTLSFTLDWHSIDTNREDVIQKCRWMEALTKNDGLALPPHYVSLIWGQSISSDSRPRVSLFGDSEIDNTWLVVSAPYRLSLFHGEYNMLPIQAYQEVTLKRVVPYSRSRDLILGVRGRTSVINRNTN